tara:strand:+ start:286 stop:1395 length:1110 start_codon:yes stop_codon:yes gene_type:complete
MSKKKLLEFGLKEADAFQKNFKIIFDRLVEGYRRFMGKDPEGVDLLKVKMEAREKAINSTKVVNQKGLTLDPDKPIIGGTQEGIETIKIKELDDVNLSKDDPMGDLEKIIKGEGDTGLPKEGLKSFKYKTPYEFSTRKEYEKYLDEMLGPDDDVFGNPMKDQMLKKFDELELKNVTPRPTTELFEEALGVRLHGDETFGELMEIKETGVHPRGEPPIKKADGGRVQFALGGPTNIIESDLINLGIPGAVQEDEFADIQGQTAGLGVLTGLTKVFGSTLGPLIFNRGRKKVLVDPAVEAAKKRAADIKKAREAEQLREVANRAAANRAAGRGGYQSSFGGDRDFMGGRGTAEEMGSFADGGLATMFVEKR